MAQIGFLELQTAVLGTQPLFLELELRRSQGIILQVSGKPFEVHVVPTISSQLTIEGFGIHAVFVTLPLADGSFGSLASIS
jgi:hypothetical protein